jgi:hypothetical protein
VDVQIVRFYFIARRITVFSLGGSVAHANKAHTTTTTTKVQIAALAPSKAADKSLVYWGFKVSTIYW